MVPLDSHDTIPLKHTPPKTNMAMEKPTMDEDVYISCPKKKGDVLVMLTKIHTQQNNPKMIEKRARRGKLQQHHVFRGPASCCSAPI